MDAYNTGSSFTCNGQERAYSFEKKKVSGTLQKKMQIYVIWLPTKSSR